MTSNGTATAIGAPLDFDAEVRHLRELLDAERARQRPLREQLEEVSERVRRLEHAIAALEAPPAPPARARNDNQSRNSNSWSISERKIQQVWDLMRHETEPFTAGGFAARQPGLSGEAVRRAIKRLRERELLRIAGSTTGGGKLYAVMPGAENIEDAHGA